MNDRLDYDAIDAVNWSTLRYAVRSGLAYRHCLTEAVAETDAMRFGRAVHAAVFEPETFSERFVVWDGGRRAGGDWERFRDAHRTSTIIRPDDLREVNAIAAAVRAHPAAAPLLTDGHAEYTLTWRDAPTGIDCKARIDFVGAESFLDLKTTRNIDIRAFGVHAAGLMYHGQMAYYADGLRANGMERTCYIIAVESDPPHDVAVMEVGEDVLWAGEVLYRGALRTVQRCRETRRWPGRYPEVVGFMLPAYAHPTDDEQDLTLAEVGI